MGEEKCLICQRMKEKTEEDYTCNYCMIRISREMEWN